MRRAGPNRRRSVGAVLALLVALPVAPPAARAAFPGENGRIAFTRSTEPGVSAIYTMAANGSDEQRLTFASGTNQEPSWSPDGTRIAFSSGRDGTEDIYVMNADGSDQRRVVDDAVQARTPAWSPDGAQIVFRSDRDYADYVPRPSELYVVTLDGGEERRLTWLEAGDEPAWAPDGSAIVFDYDEIDAPARKLFSVSPGGGTPLPFLEPGPPTSQGGADWSPDASRLVFGGDNDLWTVGRTGGRPRVLLGGPGRDFDAAWSPDGRRVLFSRLGSGDNVDLYALDLGGGEPVRLTFDPAYDSDAAWQPRPAVQPANLVGNPSFETDTTGWGSYQGRVSRLALAGAPQGGFVARAARSSGTFYSVGDSESGYRATVASTVAGATYVATGHARAASASAVGKPVKITLRERNAANVTVREISTTATLTGAFARLAVSADAAGPGNTLGMRLEQSKAVAGDAFYADAMSLVRAEPVMGATAPGPGWTNMSANAKRVSPVSLSVAQPVDVAKLRVWADGKAAGSGSQAVRGLIYADAAGAPGALLRRGDQATVGSGRAAGWLDLVLTPPVRLAPGRYWLGLHSGPTVVARFAHTATTGALKFNGDAFSDGATDPFGTASTDGKAISIHAIGG